MMYRSETMRSSRARFVSLLFAFLLARVVVAEPLAGGARYVTKDERWMNQRLDHFSPTVSPLLPSSSSLESWVW
jgi:hypothetical protein